MVLRAPAPVKQTRAAVSSDIVVCRPSRSPLTCASVVISNGSCARAWRAGQHGGRDDGGQGPRIVAGRAMAAVYRLSTT